MVPLGMAAPEAGDHHGSHRDLIYAHSDKESMPVRDRRVDAIIVPTIRPVGICSKRPGWRTGTAARW
jgi:hypothetical protein